MCHHTTNLFRTLVPIVLLSFVLVACNDVEPEIPPFTPASAATISGYGVKGPVSRGAVSAYAVTANGQPGEKLSSTTTTADGSYRLNIDNYNGTVLLEITGGTYTDEATGNILSIPAIAGSGLRAIATSVIAGSQIKASITPLTTLVVELALAKNGGLTEANISTASGDVWPQFGVTNLSATTPINILDTNANHQYTPQAEIDYAFLLAGFSQLAFEMGQSDPIDFMRVLALDGKDGKFDGLDGNIAITLNGIQLSGNSTNTDLADAINTFKSNHSDISVNISTSIMTLLKTDTDTPQLPDTEIIVLPENSSEASFQFSSTVANSTFQCSLNGAAFGVCTSPTIYPSLTEGEHTFSVQAISPSGQSDPTPAIFSWTIDTTPPVTNISSSPADLSTLTSASFSFSASEISIFQCSLNSPIFTACITDKAYSGLSDGENIFSVKATDSAGNEETEAKTFSWTVDATPPQTNITATPASLNNQTGATFEFSASETSTFQCSIDGGSFTPCNSPMAYTVLTEGNRTFEVRATDLAGNTDPTQAAYGWAIDITPPVSTITAAAPLSINGTTNSITASFSFSASKTATFQCRLDSTAFASCSSPTTYASLPEGAHHFEVQARDLAGNLESIAKTFGWEIDLSPPETLFISTPGSLDNQVDATFQLGSDDGVVSYQCNLDGSGFNSCLDDISYTNLSEGDHTFEARATDAQGNTDQSPVSYQWTIDTTAPNNTSIRINGGATTTAMSTLTIELAAEDAVAAIYAYCLKVSYDDIPPTEPDMSYYSDNAYLGSFPDECLSNVSPTERNFSISTTYDLFFPLLNGSTATMYAWYVDAAGNLSKPVTAAILLQEQDTASPSITSITINNDAAYAVLAEHVNINLHITDTTGITGYILTEHTANDPMNVTPPVIDPLISDNNWISVAEAANVEANLDYKLEQFYYQDDTIQICAWAVDAADNISPPTCDSIHHSVSWESGWSDWRADNGIWQVGTPIAGPVYCYSGTSCIGTVLDGDYPTEASSRLISPEMVLPSVVSDADRIDLYFQHQFSYNLSDSGQVQIQVWNSNSGTWGVWTNVGIAIVNSSSDWAQVSLELTNYAGERVRLGFYHVAADNCCGSGASNPDVSSGWYIDEIFVQLTIGNFWFPYL